MIVLYSSGFSLNLLVRWWPSTEEGKSVCSCEQKQSKVSAAATGLHTYVKENHKGKAHFHTAGPLLCDVGVTVTTVTSGSYRNP